MGTGCFGSWPLMGKTSRTLDCRAAKPESVSSRANMPSRRSAGRACPNARSAERVKPSRDSPACGSGCGEARLVGRTRRTMKVETKWNVASGNQMALVASILYDSTQSLRSLDPRLGLRRTGGGYLDRELPRAGWQSLEGLLQVARCSFGAVSAPLGRRLDLWCTLQMRGRAQHSPGARAGLEVPELAGGAMPTRAPEDLTLQQLTGWRKSRGAWHHPRRTTRRGGSD
jgi:hypothetical protein